MIVSLEFHPLGMTNEDLASLIAECVETLVSRNRHFLRSYPKTPSLYVSGIRYRANPDGWRDLPSLLRDRTGDCKELVAWRIAELREKGEDARVHVLLREPNDTHHVKIRRGDGSLEDPSRLLGLDREG